MKNKGEDFDSYEEKLDFGNWYMKRNLCTYSLI